MIENVTVLSSLKENLLRQSLIIQFYLIIIRSQKYIQQIQTTLKNSVFLFCMLKKMQEQADGSIDSSYPIASPPSIQQHLYSKYSSSQIYFYTSKVNQIVKQKRTQRNIQYQDIEYICDQQEYLKRWYQMKQYDSKMFTFKEYYFYHEDCPRIFMKGIEEAYTKWQDKRRDLVYKKLKLIYNEDYQSDPESMEQRTKNQLPPPEHFLLDISEYNPYSKKYYLRVEERKKKQRQKRMQQAKQNRTKFQLSQIQHDLSKMLNDISQLSEISTLYETPRKSQIYQTRKVYHSKQDSNSQQMTASNSNNHSGVKFNFKKHKGSDFQRYNQESRSIQGKKKTSLHVQQQLKDTQKKNLRNLQIKDHMIILRDNAMYGGRISPKFATNPIQSQTIKTNPSFSVSSFGVLNKKPEIKINSKRQLLKINFEPSRKKADTNYQSEQPIKVIVKSQSSSKILPKKSLQNIRVRQISVGKTVTKPDQFSDKKLVEPQNKLRSHKSEFSSMTSLKKPMFKIKQNNKQLNLGLQNYGIKKGLQLKHY